MPKSTSRRTSLQPVFEPFDMLENSPLMMPSILTPPSANGFHSEAMDDESGSSSNGHHGEKNGDAVSRDGASANGSAANGLNGSMANGLAAEDFAVHSEAVPDGILNVSPPVALNGTGNHAQMSSAIPPDPIPSHHVASPSDPASQNGHAHLNGDSSLNGNAGGAHGEASGTAVNSSQVNNSQANNSQVNNSQVNGSQVNGSQVNGSQVNGSARIPVAPAPPVVEVAPPQSSVESDFNASPANDPSATAPEPHPASGSLFVPYLVTEIRELRERRQRRRSWWRRIFG